ncbi:MAG: hypothetical protein IJ552_11515 [Prevotella sp.]|nr:hypothetical protein [Prevotella sp.]
MKIDFSRLPCYIDIKKAGKREMDIKYDFANQMYLHGRNVSFGALAMKIYNSKGEEEYDETEVEGILEFASNYPPILYDSIKDYIETNKK